MQQNQQGGQQKPQQQSSMGNDPKKTLSWEPAKDAARPAQPVAAQKTSETPGTPKRASAIIAAIVILVALGAWGVSALREHRSADKTVAGTESAATQTENTGSLTIAPQTAKDAVTVDGISVTEPTWIVVYDDNNGKPGNTLGAALAFPGENTVTVNLLRATVVGKSYLVGESASDNGSHTYSRTLTQLNSWTPFTAQ